MIETRCMRIRFDDGEVKDKEIHGGSTMDIVGPARSPGGGITAGDSTLVVNLGAVASIEFLDEMPEPEIVPVEVDPDANVTREAAWDERGYE